MYNTGSYNLKGSNSSDASRKTSASSPSSPTGRLGSFQKITHSSARLLSSSGKNKQEDVMFYQDNAVELYRYRSIHEDGSYDDRKNSRKYSDTESTNKKVESKANAFETPEANSLELDEAILLESPQEKNNSPKENSRTHKGVSSSQNSKCLGKLGIFTRLLNRCLPDFLMPRQFKINYYTTKIQELEVEKKKVEKRKKVCESSSLSQKFKLMEDNVNEINKVSGSEIVNPVSLQMEKFKKMDIDIENFNKKISFLEAKLANLNKV